MAIDHYAFLGLTCGAPLQLIKKAHKNQEGSQEVGAEVPPPLPRLPARYQKSNMPPGYLACNGAAASRWVAPKKLTSFIPPGRHHPDKGGDPGKFREIQGSYEVLSDETEKAKYDALRGKQAKEEATDARFWAFWEAAKDLQEKAARDQEEKASQRRREQEGVRAARERAERTERDKAAREQENKAREHRAGLEKTAQEEQEKRERKRRRSSEKTERAGCYPGPGRAGEETARPGTAGAGCVWPGRPGQGPARRGAFQDAERRQEAAREQTVRREVLKMILLFLFSAREPVGVSIHKKAPPPRTLKRAESSSYYGSDERKGEVSFVTGPVQGYLAHEKTHTPRGGLVLDQVLTALTPCPPPHPYRGTSLIRNSPPS